MLFINSLSLYFPDIFSFITDLWQQWPQWHKIESISDAAAYSDLTVKYHLFQLFLKPTPCREAHGLSVSLPRRWLHSTVFLFITKAHWNTECKSSTWQYTAHIEAGYYTPPTSSVIDGPSCAAQWHCCAADLAKLCSAQWAAQYFTAWCEDLQCVLLPVHKRMIWERKQCIQHLHCAQLISAVFSFEFEDI